jgi:acetyl-CoA carboxylase alpha subunit
MEKLGVQRTSCRGFEIDFIWHEKAKKLIDDIIPEPLGGAHYDRETTFKTVEHYILKSIRWIKRFINSRFNLKRMDKYTKMVNSQNNQTK